MSTKNPFLLSIVTGILIGTSYIPFLPWASWFAFVPLWMVWVDRDITMKKIFWTGWIAQFVFTIIGFNWIAHTAHEFGRLPWSISAIALLLFAAFGHLDLPLAGLIWKKLLKLLGITDHQSLSSLTVLAGIIAALKVAMSVLFPWHFGYPLLWVDLPMVQTADLIGFEGLNHIVVFSNVVFFQALWWFSRNRKMTFKWIAAWASLVLALNVMGVWIQKKLPTPDAKIEIGIVQANIGNFEKQVAEKGLSGFRASILNEYVVLTESLLAKAKSENKSLTAIVWPETAFPYTIEGQGGFESIGVKELKDHVRRWGVTLLLGGYGERLTGLPDNVANAFFIFDREGNILDDPYIKTILLAFGEYLPMDDWFPKLREWLPETADFLRGSGPRILNAPVDTSVIGGSLKIGPQICYEGLYPRFSVSLANQGAHVFVNITNDSWFGDWAEPFQHLEMTLARAIEFRRPLIRSTNTGISTVMLADGTRMVASPIGKKWYDIYTIPMVKDPKPTFYQRFPNAGFYFLGLIIFGGLFFAKQREKFQS
jgi:apolipoprotein N-acyltransferase